MDARLEWRAFAALGAEVLYDLLALRCAVFVVEQASPYLDVDGRDRGAAHLLAWSGARLVGALRATPPDGDAPATLGRIVTAPDARGAGLGSRMIAEGLSRMAAAHPGARLQIGAQAHLVSYYARFGFVVIGPVYDDGGVPHHDMALTLGDMAPPQGALAQKSGAPAP